jgi:aryl carrier-like protein
VLRGVALAPATRLPTAGRAPSLKQRLATLSVIDRDRVLIDLVRAEAASVLGVQSAQSIDPGRPLQELGLDSLMAVELRNRLARSAGLRLRPTFLFDHPTLDALARALHGEILPEQAHPAAPLLAEIDRLDDLFTAAAPGDVERDVVAERLRELLVKWTATRPAGTQRAPAQDLGTATNDELFRILDEQFQRTEADR